MVGVKDMAQGIQESQWVAVVAVVVEEVAMEVEVVVAIINLEQL
jgi:hypothetical protein